MKTWLHAMFCCIRVCRCYLEAITGTGSLDGGMFAV